MCLPPGRHLSLRCGHSRGFCGTLRRTSWTSCRTCYPRCGCAAVWGTGWWTSCGRLMRRRLSSRLPPCPRSLWTGSRSAPCVVAHGEQNSWWKCPRSSPSPQQRTAEQIIDISVPHGRGRAGQAGLQGFSQGQGSSAWRGADLVDIPVPRGGGLHGRDSTASFWFSPGAVVEASIRFFSHFSPKSEKFAVESALGVGTGCGLPMDSGGLCRLHGAGGGRAGVEVGVGAGGTP